jgi:hypothetical protein
MPGLQIKMFVKDVNDSYCLNKPLTNKNIPFPTSEATPTETTIITIKDNRYRCEPLTINMRYREFNSFLNEMRYARI